MREMRRGDEVVQTKQQFFSLLNLDRIGASKFVTGFNQIVNQRDSTRDKLGIKLVK